MNRPLLSGLLALGLAGAASALTLDSTLSSGLGYSSDPATGASASIRIDGSLTVPFGVPGSSFDFKAHALASTTELAADIDEASATFAFERPAADLDLLKTTYGRYAFQEATGLILAHPADGFRFGLKYGPADLTLAFGYTGLVLRSTSGVALTLADQNASDDLLASPRLLGLIEGSFPLGGDHRLTLSALAQQDLNPTDKLVKTWSTVEDPTKGGRLDTQYLTILGTGPITDAFDYRVHATLGTGSTMSYLPADQVYQDKPIVAGLFGADVTWFLPEFHSTVAEARILVATGDGDSTSAVEGNRSGDSNLFVPVTGTSLGVVFNPALSNLIAYQVGATSKVLSNLSVGAKVLAFQRAVEGVVNSSGVQRLGPGWMGEELDLSARWQPFSDLTATAALGAFVPTSGTFDAKSSGASFQYALNLGVSLSL